MLPVDMCELPIVVDRISAGSTKREARVHQHGASRRHLQRSVGLKLASHNSWIFLDSAGRDATGHDVQADADGDGSVCRQSALPACVLFFP